MKPLIISLYDFTGLMVEDWRRAGYQCLIVDGQHPEGLTHDTTRPGLYKLGMWLNRNRQTVLKIDKAVQQITCGGTVGAVFGFPPCDDMAVSGARWFKSKLEADPECQRNAAKRARLVADVGNFYKAPWLAENPVSILSTLWRSPDFTFDPSDYGGYLPANDTHPVYPGHIAPRDAYPKKTCIWCGNGFTKPPVKPVPRPEGKSAQYMKLGGKSLRTKNIRSATPRGFARAVFVHLKETMK